MSKEAALAFRDKVAETPQLQAQVRRAIEAGESLDEAVRLGKQNGFEFTVAEAQEAMSNFGTSELSDFELEMVAGGKGHSSGGSSSSSSGSPPPASAAVGCIAVQTAAIRIPHGW